MENIAATAFKGVESRAGLLKVRRGVAAILILTEEDRANLLEFNPTFRVIGSLKRTEYRSGIQSPSNMALVWVMICEMIRTGKPSGRDMNPPKGEERCLGGVLAKKKDVYTFIAFSGGSADQNVLIALEGLRVLGLNDFIIS